MRVLNDTKPNIFGLKLIDLNYSDLFICEYLVDKRILRAPAEDYCEKSNSSLYSIEFFKPLNVSLSFSIKFWSHNFKRGL